MPFFALIGILGSFSQRWIGCELVGVEAGISFFLLILHILLLWRLGW